VEFLIHLALGGEEPDWDAAVERVLRVSTSEVSKTSDV